MASTLIPTRIIDSPVGPLRLEADDAAVRAVSACQAQPGPRSPPHPVLDQLEAQLAEYFSGARRDFSVLLRPEGSFFQRLVWKRLLAIPYGQTRSYLDVAIDLGRPGGARAVGRANGANPVCIIIPCHRVIAADGSLGGYGGGLPMKQWLLAHERAHAPPDARASPARSAAAM